MARLINRRSVLFGLALTPLLGSGIVQGQVLPSLHVYKDSSCGCCGGWIDHMLQAGFHVSATDMPDMEAIKKRYNVPDKLYSCHTAQIDNYIIEGHVPAAAVRRLLAEKLDIIGLSAPGMPIGSPGMETPEGHKEPYDIIAFGKAGISRFARYIGDTEV